MIVSLLGRGLVVLGPDEGAGVTFREGLRGAGEMGDEGVSYAPADDEEEDVEVRRRLYSKLGESSKLRLFLFEDLAPPLLLVPGRARRLEEVDLTMLPGGSGLLLDPEVEEVVLGGGEVSIA